MLELAPGRFFNFLTRDSCANSTGGRGGGRLFEVGTAYCVHQFLASNDTILYLFNTKLQHQNSKSLSKTTFFTISIKEMKGKHMRL